MKSKERLRISMEIEAKKLLTMFAQSKGVSLSEANNVLIYETLSGKVSNYGKSYIQAKN